MIDDKFGGICLYRSCFHYFKVDLKYQIDEMICKRQIIKTTYKNLRDSGLGFYFEGSFLDNDMLLLNRSLFNRKKGAFPKAIEDFERFVNAMFLNGILVDNGEFLNSMYPDIFQNIEDVEKEIKKHELF